VGSRAATSKAGDSAAASRAAASEPMISRLAPAKINLYLHVTGRRPDGYHLIDSLFAFADFGDRIEAHAGDGDLRLTVDGPFAAGLGAAADNLVIKAARALAVLAAAKASAGADIRLSKTLPVASGIGGGSSDAAATLHALNRLWALDASLDDLTALAIKLGADVPACLRDRPVQASGTGEITAPAVALPPCAVVLVNPGQALLTADVFKAFATERSGYSAAAPLTEAPTSAEDLAEALRTRRNDLENAAIDLIPAISVVLEALKRASGCGLARLSGSGATCFGLFADREAAATAAIALASAHPGWWVKSGALARGQV
jgi:4-diphosphocytidyl-2-C-methyl-D-erythritol kinase